MSTLIVVAYLVVGWFLGLRAAVEMERRFPSEDFADEATLALMALSVMLVWLPMVVMVGPLWLIAWLVRRLA